MKLRILLPVLSAVAVAACSSDKASVAAANPNAIEIAALRSNPPPPSLLGASLGIFSSPTSTSAAAPSGGASLDAAPSEAYTNVRFFVDKVELNANSALTSYWNNFPTQQLPAKAYRIGAISRGRVAWSASSGMTTGQGRVFAFDPRINAYIVVDLTQIQIQGNAFGDCFQTGRDCVTINAPVVAQIYQIIGKDSQGNWLFNIVPTAPANLSWIDPATW
jgi:hypothetical protein